MICPKCGHKWKDEGRQKGGYNRPVLDVQRTSEYSAKMHKGKAVKKLQAGKDALNAQRLAKQLTRERAARRKAKQGGE